MNLDAKYNDCKTQVDVSLGTIKVIYLHLQLALWVNHTNPLGLLIGARGEEQDVLVDEHAQGDERHVEPVQEVLDRDVHVGLDVLLVVEVEDALGIVWLIMDFWGKNKNVTLAICQTTSLLSFFIVSRVPQKFLSVSSFSSAESKRSNCSKLRQKSSCTQRKSSRNLSAQKENDKEVWLQ